MKIRRTTVGNERFYMVMQVIFWILLLLAAIGAIVPDTASPYLGRGRWVVCLILIAILGFVEFGNPVHK